MVHRLAAAPIDWQPVRDATGDGDVATNGRVVKAYACGARPTVNGVAFADFGGQRADRHTLGAAFGQFYTSRTLSLAYVQLLTGGVQDTAHLSTPTPQTVTLGGLTPGRQYQVQLWVADNRSWPGLQPAFSSSAETITGSARDTHPPTLHWEGGPAGPTAQFVIGTFTADRARQTLTFTPTAGFFNGKPWFSAQLNALVLLDLSPGEPPAVTAPAPETIPVVKTLDDCNLTWATPSDDSLGSMPLGNGDVGANVWVEPNGDLLCYVSKVDAYDSGHVLRKLGRVRVRLDPALEVDQFRQTLVLRDAAITIAAGERRLRVWVDANAPMLRLEGEGGPPTTATVSFETLRPALELADDQPRLAWGYRNETSAWADHVKAQNTPEFAAKVHDPLLHRTSGCRLSGAGFVRQGQRELRATGLTTLDLRVRVLSSQTGTPAEWFGQLEQPVASDWAAHQAYWHAFWDRSHIFVSGCGDQPVKLEPCRFTQVAQGALAYRGHDTLDPARNAFQLSQRYALERFCQAAAGRGAVPPPYNGSIFTMDMPAGALGFDRPKGRPTSADDRDWASLSFMWQNTRHPYWSMAARGDYDTLLPGLQFVRDGLDVCRDRCRRTFGHDGAYIMEASWWHNVGVFNPGGVPGHLRYHFLATIELPAIMCDYYEHTRDPAFLHDVLLPCADEFIRFYEFQFPRRDARGKLLMAPASTVETYQPVTNPNTEVGALRWVLSRLLSYDLDAERRAHWAKLLDELPPLALRRARGLDLLAVGDRYAPGREICETPELYSVYPFRQAWLGTPERLALARQSFHVRCTSLDGTADGQAVETGGWQAAPVQAACLGLSREAARLTSLNFADDFVHWTDNVDPAAPFPQRPRPRFPAFWETKMDGTPDNDHGANSASALQSMLLQSDGRRLLLLPAWPEDWDVDFKLHAPDRTWVECSYRGGRVVKLVVEPVARRADVVDGSTPEQRLHKLVRVACADRNWLFGLPPMLDGLPLGGPATSAWLARYGESLTGVRAGPWPGCVFRDNVLYLHRLDGPLVVPELPAKEVNRRWLTAEHERPDAILRLEYDQPLEPLALAAARAGSLTLGREVRDGVVDLGASATVDRVELTLDNPGHRRGQGRAFELQAQQPGGGWHTVARGTVFGAIWARPIEPSTAQVWRVTCPGAAVRQLELYADRAPR